MFKKETGDFIGLLIDENNNKSNGVVNLNDDNILFEKRSRFNGKIKDSFNVDYDDLSLNDVNRLNFNKLQLKIKGNTYILKTIDDDMLDNFEDKLLKILSDSTNNLPIENGLNSLNSSNNSNNTDIPDQIRKYYGLYKDGILTEKEFEDKKKELLRL